MTDGTFLHRQINPAFVQNGRVTSQAFRPTPKDAGLLSVYDGDLIAPEASWKHFTMIQKLASVGVLSVTVAECKVHGLPARPEPQAFVEHAVIDFNGLGANQIEKKAKWLKEFAIARGWQYQAGPP